VADRGEIAPRIGTDGSDHRPAAMMPSATTFIQRESEIAFMTR